MNRKTPWKYVVYPLGFVALYFIGAYWLGWSDTVNYAMLVVANIWVAAGSVVLDLEARDDD